MGNKKRKNKRKKKTNAYENIERRKQRSAEKEYEMLRTEILQYMEEYQSVRNMMYLATAAILGLNSVMFQNYYLFLLPLVVILPSYMVSYNYWKSVTYKKVKGKKHYFIAFKIKRYTGLIDPNSFVDLTDEMFF